MPDNKNIVLFAVQVALAIFAPSVVIAFAAFLVLKPIQC